MTSAVMESMAVLSLPAKEAVFFALGFGLTLGAVVALMDISLIYAEKKLNLEKDDSVKYFLLFVCIAGALFLLVFLGTEIFAPDMQTREEVFNRNLETLGYPFFFGLSFSGMLAISTLTKIFLNRLTKSESAENKALD